MKQTEWWKNFDLNTELHTSGAFVYDSLHRLHQSQQLTHDDEIFEVLYHLSVGLERLMKVVIVLLEHDHRTNQVDFEKTLITHDLRKLLPRITAKRALALGKPHHALIHCLSEFYKLYRYDRYCLDTIRGRDMMRASFWKLIEKGSGIKLDTNDDFFPSVEMPRIRQYLGRLTGKICSQLYDLVVTLAGEHGLFTYEIRSDTKAYKIFLRREYDFASEELALKELTLFMLLRYKRTNLAKIMSGLRPLPFDPPLALDSMDAFTQFAPRFDLVDMVEEMHSSIRNKLKHRIELLEYLGARSANLCMEEEGEAAGEPPTRAEAP